MCSLSSQCHKFNFPIIFVYLLIGVIFVCSSPTSYFHIYIFLLIKTTKIFYFHWEGEGGKLTAMVAQPLYQLQFYLQKQEYFYFLSVLIFRDGKIMSILILLILLSTTIVTTLSPIERHDMLKRYSDVSLSLYQFWSPHFYIFLMLSRTYFS